MAFIPMLVDDTVKSHQHETSDINNLESSVMNTVKTFSNRTTAANVADTSYTAFMFRASSLNSSDVTPTINGSIAWTYK